MTFAWNAAAQAEIDKWRARCDDLQRKNDELERRIQTVRTQVDLEVKVSRQHAELMRRRRRDVEIAAHVPAIAARLQAIAEDIKSDAAWWRDPEIDWTGIER